MKRPSCKNCRRLSVSVCGRVKCALKTRPYPPGQHGKSFRRGGSEFGSQLAEKQKVKLTYGIREKQFRKYFSTASKSKGMTAMLLVRMLEMRLDNVVYRLGLASSRSQARQMVGHGHFTVNGRRVDVPSFQVKKGDVIAIRAGSAEKKIFSETKIILKNFEAPEWLALDKEKLTGAVLGFPEGVELPFNMQLVTEFYSR